MWKRFRLLSAADRRLLVEAAALLVFIRIGLRALPLSLLRWLLNRGSLSDLGHDASSKPVDRIVWAVKTTARRLRGTTCLLEALAVDRMLRRGGYSPDLRLGVRRNEGRGAARGEGVPASPVPRAAAARGARGATRAGVGAPRVIDGASTSLEAHAWVECNGVVVVGSVGDLSEYAVLSPESTSARDETGWNLAALLKGHDVSWDSLRMTSAELLDICAREDLFGLVHQRMCKLTRLDAWPQSLRDELAREARDAAALELARCKEICSVLARLADNGIRPILLKGTALAYSVYETPSARPRTDTDLLIRRDDEEAVRQVTADLGYRATLYSDGDVVFRQFEMRKQDEFGVDYAFDFHWRISTQSAFADMLTYDELVGSAEPIPALGPHALAPAALHSLLLACSHPVMHHQNVERPLWIYDIHLLVSRLSVPEFERFADLAVSRKIAAVCAHGLTRARFWFGTPVPERVVARLLSVPAEPSAEYLRPARRWRHELASNVRGLPRWRDRVRLLREVVFPRPQYMLGSYRFGAGAVTKLRLKPPSDGRKPGRRTFVTRRSAAAAKTASKAEQTETCFIGQDIGFRRCLGLALLPALYVHRGVYGAWKVLAGKK